MKYLLVVDDEPSVRYSLSSVFENDYNVLTAAGGEEALEIVRNQSVDVAIIDVMMPGMSGLELLPRLLEIDPRLTAIVLSAIEDISRVVEAVKLGASHYLTKPFDVDQVKLIVEMALKDRERKTEISVLETDISRWYDPNEVIGDSIPWEKTLDTVRRAADSADTTIMLYGESGTGKELLARLVHELSSRADAPIVPIHCAAIPEQLLESEMFGHEKGSFTGATESREGCVEMADGGTLFLDEIGEMPLAMQSKLLRFLQDHEFMRVGGRTYRRADVRVVGATNRNLRQGVDDGWFREDLFYRLNVIPITIPPLRERHGDVPLLVDHFIQHFRREHSMKLAATSPEAMKLLEAYEWPGNVRELRNLIERTAVLYGDESAIKPTHLPPEITKDRLTSQEHAVPTGTHLPVDLETEVAKTECRLIQDALGETGGNLSKAALLLQTTRRKLQYKAEQHGLLAGAKDEPRKG